MVAGEVFFFTKTSGPNEVISAYKVAKKRPVDDYLRRVKDESPHEPTREISGHEGQIHQLANKQNGRSRVFV